MFVSVERKLDVSMGVAQLRLADLVHGSRLNDASLEAYQGGIDHLLRVGPIGDLPCTSRLVRVQIVDPVCRDGAVTWGMRWEATGVTSGLFPVLDANIRLTGEGGVGTRLTLTASYRPPLGALGAEMDRLLLNRVATATVRTFLTHVADALQGVPRPGRRDRRALVVRARTGTGA